VNLVMAGDFTLRSGKKSGYKVECDALTTADWEGIAAAIVEEGILPPFSGVSGVPRGGIPLADAMRKYVTPEARTLLICEDIVTTGGSMERWREELRRDPAVKFDDYVGVCFIARGRCPDWVKPLLRMTTKE
jgi:orotate phosphoribosyltransferase